ncbi:ArsR family transcriptional regulator [Campylobacter sp.]|uniref:ArsR family transcriptional regulator n=1 Tax=Campylobacter sp. TaxID=205 RepID=UPI0026DC51B1|nr:ArsR family transcriptional regulator [Campylobacter sp.]MDO4673800.1 ArsR family transcriptional regulator [Campylobacter sp.]
MDEKLEKAVVKILGEKRFALLKYLCAHCDENGFIGVKIATLEENLRQSKPTLIASLKFFEEKKILSKLKNSFYQLNLNHKGRQ